jgi:hypothetical protein
MVKMPAEGLVHRKGFLNLETQNSAYFKIPGIVM